MAILNLNDLFQWGPIDCAFQPIHYSAWAGVHYLKKDFGMAWPKTVLVLKGRQGTWFNENSRLIDLGKEMVNKLVLDKKVYIDIQKLWNLRIKKLCAAEKEIQKTTCAKLSDSALLKLYEQFVGAYYHYWSIGMLAEPINFGAEAYLAQELRKKLKEQQFNDALVTLTAPTQRSFFAEEEVELLQIAQKKTWRQLKRHAQRYFWILNSYYETRVLDENYFKQVITEKWTEMQKIRQTMRHMRAYPQETIAKKKVLIKKYKLGKEVQRYAAIVNEFMCFQDERKKYNWIANHYVDLFCREFARRKEIRDFYDVKYLTPEEIMRNYTYLGDLVPLAHARRILSVAVYYDTTPACHESFSGEQAQLIEKELFLKDIGNLNEVTGLVVSKPVSTISGTVKILSTPAELDKLRQGEILITTMTSPDYILAMKRAKAIITDVGGITSHAAIVSRELGIPCIVAARVATKVFKDGDMVEMDLERGIVKKISLHT